MPTISSTPWWIAFAACTPDADPERSPTNETPSSPAVVPEFVDGPTVVEGGPLVPLSRELHVTLSVPAELELSASDGAETVAWISSAATAHAVPLVGLHADGAWTLTVRAVDSERGAAEATVDFTTGSLPGPLPNFDLLVSDPARMQPGLTLLPLFSPPDGGFLVLLDDTARVVWIYGPVAYKFTEVGTYDGHLRVLDNTQINEIDWMGNVVRRWTSSTATEQDIAVQATHFHHEVFETERGTFLAFTKTPTRVHDYPTSEEDPVPHADSRVADDTVLELDVATGEILDEWHMTDILDTRRLGYESLSVDQTGFEWTHMNGAAEDPVNDRWVVSCRNQDAVVAFDQATSDIAWILAPHENWHGQWLDELLTPVGTPFEWSYHQHAVKYDAEGGRVLMFDNGNYRASPWTGEEPDSESESYSRVVQYTVDEVARTVRQDWEFRTTPDVYARAMGDADWLPNGNVLADFALVGTLGGIPMEAYGRGKSTVRVVEIDPESGDAVWHVDIWRPLVGAASGWQAYRVARIDRPFAP